MTWTSPSTFVAGAVLSAATLNLQVRDNMLWLKGGLQSGLDSVTTVAAGTAAKTVTFPVSFPSAPQVFAIPLTTSPDLLRTSVANTISSTQATIEMYRTSGSGAVPFAWFATVL